jgi:hypothetical protein
MASMQGLEGGMRRFSWTQSNCQRNSKGTKRCKGHYVMTEEKRLARSEKVGILKRLVTKFSASKLSRAEKIEILKRLIRRYSTSRLSKLETINVLNRFIRKLVGNDVTEAPKDLSDESKK